MGLEAHSAGAFSAASFLLLSLSDFEGKMSKTCLEPSASLGRQLRGASMVYTTVEGTQLLKT